MRWYAEAIDKVYGQVAPTGRDALAVIEREPVGVVGAVVPWNYPLIITAWKLGPALATGNSVVLKPAEQSPLSALLLAELAAEAGLPDGVLERRAGLRARGGPGAGPPPGRRQDRLHGLGRGRAALPGLRRGVQRQAGRARARRQEPARRARRRRPRRRGEAIAWGIFYNAGQTCHAGSRVIVERAVRDELVARVAAAGDARARRPARPGHRARLLVDEEALQRVLGHVDRAARRRRAGAPGRRAGRPGAGRQLPRPDRARRGHGGRSLSREEVFGPVLSVLEADGPDEAVRLANATEYGLAAAVWTRDVGARGGSRARCAPGRSGSTPTTPPTSPPPSAA